MTRVLAFDFGASSGRAMLGSLDGGVIRMEEIHRFENDPVFVRGTLYWDVLRLFYNIKQGITKAMLRGGFDSIGIDTWGVDFGLVRKEGQLVSNPVHYRDSRTDDYELCPVTPEEAYAATGIEITYFNTLYQLNALARKHPVILADADHVLLMPDLFNYMLTGTKKAEYTIASTTELMNARTRQWDKAILTKACIPEHLMCDIVMPGTLCDVLSDDICSELGCDPVPVVCIASHDTASAVAAVPTQEKDFLFLSCGTWCLLGTVLDEPLIDEKAKKHNFTNEGTVEGKIQFLKNIMGTWLIAESRRQWKKEGQDLSFGELEEMAREAPAFKCFIDPDGAQYVRPGNLPERIRAFCAETGQSAPELPGEFVRCIDESLALKFRSQIECLEDCVGKSYDTIYLIGGGVKSALLCQFTANATGRRVVAGPEEATVLGNIGVQLMYHKDLETIQDLRASIQKGTDLQVYEPRNKDEWNRAYARFTEVVAGGKK